MAVRIGAVGYLNARPLTWALDREPARWSVRYDVPSVCAELLHRGDVDLGLIPSIEYLQRGDYRLVPGVGIGSRGDIATVALYTSKAMRDVRTVALDTSSRTSVALTRVLCAKRYGITPQFVPHRPDLAAMVEQCDAALLIGDPAFDADHNALGLRKIDLGGEWTAMTGLPFVWAFWAGRLDAAPPDVCRALAEARDRGVQAIDRIAADYAPGDPARAASIWHNRLFNPNLPDDVRVLGFQPDWSAAEAAPGPQRPNMEAGGPAPSV
jgi:chorismate dehydratase